ncbi:hypothetical protein ACLOJK_038472, partial [Asimina triloba]
MKKNEKFQQHAVRYRSASWNQVLSFLRDDDVHIPHSDSVSKAILKLVADYERTSWSLVRSFLRHEGVWNPRSSSVSKSILEERFQGFNLSFEEIYRKETTWLIHDEQLRIELRASISSKVLVEYRLFLERFSSDLKDEKHRDRYLKYSVEDLQESLLDLFKGSSKGLHK